MVSKLEKITNTVNEQEAEISQLSRKITTTESEIALLQQPQPND